MNNLEIMLKNKCSILRRAKLNNELVEYHKIIKCPCCYTKLTIDNTVNMLNCNHVYVKSVILNGLMMNIIILVLCRAKV